MRDSPVLRGKCYRLAGWRVKRPFLEKHDFNERGPGGVLCQWHCFTPYKSDNCNDGVGNIISKNWEKKITVFFKNF